MARRALAGLLLLLAGCSTGAEAGSTTTAAPETTSTTTTTAPPVTAPPTTAAPVRPVHEQAWTPFATVGGIVLHHPSARVERVAFHEANHDGARDLTPLPTAAAATTLESRERPTSDRSAADVVIDPDAEVRAVVTGRVVRAGTYVLYGDHRDDYAVVEPDQHPGWEVKVLHIEGVSVGVGQRVEAGVTPIAGRARVLPFPSQVEDHTGLPAWPHVHVEVIDPTVPDRPTGPGCP
jgi:hypothetical protein